MHDWTMTATIYTYSTDQLQGISLSRAKRPSERVRHALTTRAVSRLIVANYARKRVHGKRVAQCAIAHVGWALFSFIGISAQMGVQAVYATDE